MADNRNEILRHLHASVTVTAAGLTVPYQWSVAALLAEQPVADPVVTPAVAVR